MSAGLASLGVDAAAEKNAPRLASWNSLPVSMPGTAGLSIRTSFPTDSAALESQRQSEAPALPVPSASELPPRPQSQGCPRRQLSGERVSTLSRPSSSGAVRLEKKPLVSLLQGGAPPSRAGSKRQQAGTEPRMGWQKRNPSVDSIFGLDGPAKTAWERKDKVEDEKAEGGLEIALPLNRTVSALRPDGGALSRTQKKTRGLPVLTSKQRAAQEAAKHFLELTGGVDVKVRVRRIPRVEERGIMVKQLELLVDFVRKRSHPKTTVIRGWKDAISGDPLYLRSVDMYQLNRHLIKPLTQQAQCSYVEAVAFSETSQQPAWFVSHWWGEPVMDLVANVKKHVQTRYPQMCGVTTAYWVSAFAFNPHDPEPALTKHPADSPILKVLHNATGMLLVIDRNSPAKVFQRTWCCFEEFLLVQGIGAPYHISFDKVLLDIACTDADGEQHVITDGLTEKEDVLEERWHQNLHEASGWAAKTQRESNFPVSALAGGLAIKVVEAQTTKDVDRQRLLAVMADRDVDTALDPKLPIYDDIDVILRARIASIALRQAIQQRVDISDLSTLPLAKALRDNNHQEALHLNFACCWKITDKDLEVISTCIPLSQHVRRITLNFRSCYHLTCLDSLLGRVADVAHLKQFVLLCENCLGLKMTPGLHGFGASLSTHGRMEKVFLDFKGCDQMGNLEEFTKHLANVPTINNCIVVDARGDSTAMRERPLKQQPKTKVRRMRKVYRTRTQMLAWVGAPDAVADEEDEARSVAAHSNFSDHSVGTRGGSRLPTTMAAALSLAA
mmetsp:Transcript_13375/g.31374  ORF Transcript_13375/g.31374 Transcript_13375/m.31374 type:complete len:784 (-) Transcript_13375:155-2506(-)|eukprot:CAMPEP_0178405828 /NCGR_PEP_ID=MMETSP0689_2-20121128/18599_1 /TAXON_ID=160604 /ORGANISM="Amphidinium massartii, Strain CS-259" /LENGTH=783 /DNA_ID=CAMNT_0020026853 /DNA_START=33 /DNA_END=2384 /DNA_ORIENTATION=-